MSLILKLQHISLNDRQNILQREKNIISNFIQAELWTTKYKDFSERDSDFPIFVFFDDFETGRCGSAAGEAKLGGLYTSIPCLPPQIVAKMSSIFLSTIFYSKHREGFGNEAAFREVINELNNLQKNGLTINIGNKEVTLSFQYVLILGDNLGLNCTCGFSKSFTANYYCRSCSASSLNVKNLLKK